MKPLIFLIARLPIEVWSDYHDILATVPQPYDQLPFHTRLPLADKLWDYATDCILRAVRIRNHISEHQPYNEALLTAEMNECEYMHSFIHSLLLLEFPHELVALVGDETDDIPDPDDCRDNDNWHADDEIDEDCYRFPHQ
jgi:hypothetical protein